jgi:hypothetical protein
MTQEAPDRESLLALYDALAQRQLRHAGAEVAAALAHAVGTPLNVISGRAELIRHDPSNALAQVTRIEEQVKKLANGLRQVVDYLAVPEAVPPAKLAAAAAAGPAVAGAARIVAAQPVSEEVIVDAKAVLDDLLALADPLARAANVELSVSPEGLAGARVERWHALGTLISLVSAALHQVTHPSKGARAEDGRVASSHLRVGGSIATQGVVFELVVPGLALVEGWQIEHFQARPPATDCPELYRTLSICGAVVRGHGGRLLLEAAPAGGIIIRFSCRNAAVEGSY